MSFDVIGCPMYNAFQAFPDVRAVAVGNKVVAVATGFQGVNCWFTTRTVKFFLTVGLHGNKPIIGFQSFEFVGIGEEAACVTEDASKPCSLFFYGEEVVIHFSWKSG